MGRDGEQFPIIFTHTSRTGGGCLMQVLRRQYKASQVFPFYVKLKGGSTREALEEFIALPDERKKQFKVLGGHVHFGLHRHFDRYTYLTLFRDPVKRIVSLYTLALTSPRHYLHNIVVSNRMKLADFVGSGISPELNNGLTRMISGVEKVKFGGCTRELLEQAKHHLDAHYPVFGITERYDESVLLMKHYYGWGNPYYRTRNFSRTDLARQEVPPETLKVIQEHNALDIELYRYADQKFQAMLGRQDSAFQAELARFKKVNGWVKKLSSPRNGYFAITVLDAYSKLKHIAQ